MQASESLSRLSDRALLLEEGKFRREHGIKASFPGFSEVLEGVVWRRRGGVVSVLCGVNVEEDGAEEEEEAETNRVRLESRV